MHKFKLKLLLFKVAKFKSKKINQKLIKPHNIRTMFFSSTLR